VHLINNNNKKPKNKNKNKNKNKKSSPPNNVAEHTVTATRALWSHFFRSKYSLGPKCLRACVSMRECVTKRDYFFTICEHITDEFPPFISKSRTGTSLCKIVQIYSAAQLREDYFTCLYFAFKRWHWSSHYLTRLQIRAKGFPLPLLMVGAHLSLPTLQVVGPRGDRASRAGPSG
jgi:hypothetical protein